jgi:hypothetical protein
MRIGLAAWRIAIGEWISATGLGFAVIGAMLLVVAVMATVPVVAMRCGSQVSISGPKVFVFKAKAEYSNKIEKVNK